MHNNSTRTFQRWLAVACLCCTLGLGTAVAAPFDDGIAAYYRGDYAQALKILRPLAEMRDARAQNTLGLMYGNGQGVPQNYPESLKWFRLAIAQGQADAEEPAFIYQYDRKSKVTGVNGLVGIEKPFTKKFDNCDQRIADIKVDEVVYDGASDVIMGFRAMKPAPNEWYGIFKIDSDAVYKAIPNASRSDVQELIKKRAQLIVVYQVCGSGGFITVRDIFKKSAINNP